ncbi:MAG: hypothetical protein AB8G23_23755 [Myxococcota bacterium]
MPDRAKQESALEAYADDVESEVAGPSGKPTSHDRRAYFRVRGLLPIRVTALEESAVESEVFDLSMPDPLIQPVEEAGEDAPLMARLRRIEEKLDLLLGAAHVDTPRQLSGRDRQSVVFSGTGLCLDVPQAFEKGDPYKVEILLPPPYSRMVRGVARCVADAAPAGKISGTRPMALVLNHIEPDERDALVAYSYDLQRFDLRSRQSVAPETTS